MGSVLRGFFPEYVTKACRMEVSYNGPAYTPSERRAFRHHGGSISHPLKLIELDGTIVLRGLRGLPLNPLMPKGVASWTAEDES